MKIRPLILLFILAMLTISVFSLTACNEENGYADYEHLRDWNDFETLDEDTEGLYFLYIYFVGCPACADLEDDIFNFASDNAGDYPVYFVDLDDIAGEPPFDTGEYVPALIPVEDGENLLADEEEPAYIGPSAIRNIFSTVEDGTYEPGEDE